MSFDITHNLKYVFFTFRNVTSSLYCWKQDNNSFMNETCQTGELHPSNIVSRAATPSDNTTTANSTDTVTVTQCYTYTTDEILPASSSSKEGTKSSKAPEIVTTSVETQYGCDTKSYCKGVSIGQNIKVSIEWTHKIKPLMYFNF